MKSIKYLVILLIMTLVVIALVLLILPVNLWGGMLAGIANMFMAFAAIVAFLLSSQEYFDDKRQQRLQKAESLYERYYKNLCMLLDNFAKIKQQLTITITQIQAPGEKHGVTRTGNEAVACTNRIISHLDDNDTITESELNDVLNDVESLCVKAHEEYLSQELMSTINSIIETTNSRLLTYGFVSSEQSIPVEAFLAKEPSFLHYVHCLLAITHCATLMSEKEKKLKMGSHAKHLVMSSLSYEDTVFAEHLSRKYPECKFLKYQ